MVALTSSSIYAQQYQLPHPTLARASSYLELDVLLHGPWILFHEFSESCSEVHSLIVKPAREAKNQGSEILQRFPERDSKQRIETFYAWM